MAKHEHQPVIDLLNELSDANKYVSIEVHEKPMPAVADVATVGDQPCKVWGYDPVTHQRICIQY